MSKPLAMRNNGSGNSKAPPPPPPQNTAAKEAATRGRALASNYRKSANSVDAIRAKVKAEMKAEQAAAKERALAIVAEKEQAENERSAEAEQRRMEARRTYAAAMAEERKAEQEQQQQERQQQPQQPQQPQPPQDADELLAEGGEQQQQLFGAEEEVGSQVERIQQLLRDRAERRKDDNVADASYRERLQARRHDPDRFAGAAASNATSESRSLFRWAPPPPASASSSTAPPQPPPGMSDAARKAWEWANKRPADE